MRFEVVGANSESGDDVDVMVDATTREEVEKIAHDRGILVSEIKTAPAAPADGGSISLVDDAPSSPPASPAAHAPAPASAPHQPEPGHGNGHAPHPAPAPTQERHGFITLNADSPSDSVHTSEGHRPEMEKHGGEMEYHILMNQALYLLETAVNKHLKDGWEPQGGLTVGTSNNAMQYFQTVVRRKKKS